MELLSCLYDSVWSLNTLALKPFVKMTLCCKDGKNKDARENTEVLICLNDPNYYRFEKGGGAFHSKLPTLVTNLKESLLFLLFKCFFYFYLELKPSF